MVAVQASAVSKSLDKEHFVYQIAKQAVRVVDSRNFIADGGGHIVQNSRFFQESLKAVRQHSVYFCHKIIGNFQFFTDVLYGFFGNGFFLLAQLQQNLRDAHGPSFRKVIDHVCPMHGTAVGRGQKGGDFFRQKPQFFHSQADSLSTLDVFVKKAGKRALFHQEQPYFGFHSFY